NNYQIDDKEVIARTNNIIERYNHRFREIFMNTYPNITAFVVAIRAEFEIYSQNCIFSELTLLHISAELFVSYCHETQSIDQYFVPCAWALMSSKSAYLYCKILYMIVALPAYHFLPRVDVADFESALLEAIKY
ncbi:hypothetical protein MXB_602, partial [Myxobolus squamalis]